MCSYREIVHKIKEMHGVHDYLSDYHKVMEDLMEKLEKQYPDLYKDTMEKLEALVYYIPVEKARKIVISMRPFGEHWTYETVKSFVESKGIYKECVEYYLVMNMVYNDYYDVAVNFAHQDDTEFFYESAHAFINDPDGKQFKVEKYFMD